MQAADRTLADDHLRVHRLRSLASQLLLLCCALAVIHAETAGFSDGRLRSLCSTLLIAFIVASNLWSASLSGHNADLRRWLHRAEAVLVACLFLVASRVELMHVFAVYWVVRLPVLHGARTSVLLALAALLVALALTLARGEPWETQRAVVMTLAYGLALFISHMAESERRLHRQAHALNRELEAAQQQLAEAATQRERLRIARDMHDLLGHQLTVQVLNLEVAHHHARGEARPHVAQSLAMGKAMLGDLRDAVRELREPPATDFAQALRAWLARVPRLHTHLQLPDGLVIDDPRIATALLRCVQEAATNTLRHSGARRFSVVLHASGDQLVLVLGDDGCSPADIVPGSGLRGMRERIEALAGRLDWHAPGGSLQLTITLPLHRSAHR